MALPKNGFVKSHGLGNEYIVLDSAAISFPINKKSIKTLCNIHFGIGSDGILLLTPSQKADFGFRIFNPDASEAEKSGNGLRIFAKFLFDYGYTLKKSFTIETIAGVVKAIIEEEQNGKASLVTIEMGKATFKSDEIPVKLNSPECIDFPLAIDGQTFLINCVSVGNPHCVIFKEQLSEEEIKLYGPKIESHPMFPNRINVQFVKPVNRKEAKILIFERGAGFTLASGSSSSAVACVLRKKNYIDNEVTIKMPGGELKLTIDDNYNIILTGEVKQIAEGILSYELINEFV
jgi:diaminopimelate epimerase